MPVFAYSAATATGQRTKGVENAPSAAVVERQLTERGLYPVSISERSGSPGGSGRSLIGKRTAVVIAARSLATLLDAGFPLDRALGAAARVSTRRDVAGAVQATRVRVREGARLGNAMSEHPRIFPRLAVGMARAGERGGRLGAAFLRLADQLEREQELRSRFASAMLYPAVLAVVGGIAVFVLLTFVLPRFASILRDAGAAMPWSTAALISAGGFMQRWWPLVVGGILAMGLMLIAYYRSADGRARVDSLLLRIPLIGRLRRLRAAAGLGRSLAALLNGGVPVLTALDIAGAGLADEAAAEEVRRVRERVRAGGRLAGAFASGHIFPELFVQMVEVGEEGGRLPEMLERAAVGIEQELNRGLDRFARLAEPALIIVFGVAIGFVALGLLRAIYAVNAGGL